MAEIRIREGSPFVYIEITDRGQTVAKIPTSVRLKANGKFKAKDPNGGSLECKGHEIVVEDV